MLEIGDLHVSYGAIAAVRGISLTVSKGEFVGMIGANGAGKTTVLSTIAGVRKPKAGTIAFEDQSIVDSPPETIVKKGIAMVPENREIFPALTVEENLRLGAYMRKNPVEFRADLERMTARFPILGERLQQAAGTLSGGEQQQLAIARALMSHPRLLMLDEPSLGLAPRLVEEVFRLITELHNEGVTILLVEQNVNQTLKIVDRAYLLSMGRVEAEGTPEVLRERVDVEKIYLGAR